jgi:hypothetical protein
LNDRQTGKEKKILWPKTGREIGVIKPDYSRE